MTDRGRSALRQSEDQLTIGPSSMRWTGNQLVIDVNEWGSPPLPGAIRGTITLKPSAVTEVELLLTPDGSHIWRPFAPTASIEVDLNAKGWQWDGHGYFDANFGTAALEADFTYWTWARYPRADSGALCIYDATRRDGSRLDAAIAFDVDGKAKMVEAPARTDFKRTAWQVSRSTRADKGTIPRQVKPMLDAPFYSRSLVETQIDGETVQGVHEALDLNRFRSPLIKPMLACRVPRRANWSFD